MQADLYIFKKKLLDEAMLDYGGFKNDILIQPNKQNTKLWNSNLVF
jgi:hypothetical protein